MYLYGPSPAWQAEAGLELTTVWWTGYHIGSDDDEAPNSGSKLRSFAKSEGRYTDNETVMGEQSELMKSMIEHCGWHDKYFAIHSELFTRVGLERLMRLQGKSFLSWITSFWRSSKDQIRIDYRIGFGNPKYDGEGSDKKTPSVSAIAEHSYFSKSEIPVLTKFLGKDWTERLNISFAYDPTCHIEEKHHTNITHALHKRIHKEFQN